MTTIKKFMEYNKNMMNNISKFNYLVSGEAKRIFSDNFFKKQIHINFQFKNRYLVLVVNNQFSIYIAPDTTNVKMGGKKKKSNSSKKTRKRRSKMQKGGDKGDVVVIFLAFCTVLYVFQQVIGYMNPMVSIEHDTNMIQSNNPIDLWSKVVNTTLSEITLISDTSPDLSEAVKRVLTDGNTAQITKLPSNMTQRPISYAELNITNLPHTTEMYNMFDKVLFPPHGNQVFAKSLYWYKMVGTWKIMDNKSVDIQMYDEDKEYHGRFGYSLRFPDRVDVNQRISNYLIESINIQKQIGMIGRRENEGYFRLLLMNIMPGNAGHVHYDQTHNIKINISKFHDRNPEIGVNVQLLYLKNEKEMAAPYFIVDEDGNPTKDTAQQPQEGIGEAEFQPTKRLVGNPTPGNMQLFSQRDTIKHRTEGIGKIPRKALNLAILPMDKVLLRKVIPHGSNKDIVNTHTEDAKKNELGGGKRHNKSKKRRTHRKKKKPRKK